MILVGDVLCYSVITDWRQLVGRSYEPSPFNPLRTNAASPLNLMDQWAAQQPRAAHEKALMNRSIGFVILAVLILFGLMEHGIKLPF